MYISYCVYLVVYHTMYEKKNGDQTNRVEQVGEKEDEEEVAEADHGGELM